MYCVWWRFFVVNVVSGDILMSNILTLNVSTKRTYKTVLARCSRCNKPMTAAVSDKAILAKCLKCLYDVRLVL